MKTPLITISIISHRNVKKIKALLHSFFRYEKGDKYQVLITDNLGTEDYSDPVFQKATILQNHVPLGFAQNHNKAFLRAQGEYFCALNPDILFIQSIFDALIQQIEKDQADILAPLIIDQYGVVQDSFRNLPTPGELLLRRLRKKPRIQMPLAPIAPDWLAGMFLLMRAETFCTLDGFDERYHLYFEDVDFSTRARLAGFRLLLDPALQVQHDAHRASHNDLKYLFWHMQSAWNFFSSETYKRAKHSGNGIISL